MIEKTGSILAILVADQDTRFVVELIQHNNSKFLAEKNVSHAVLSQSFLSRNDVVSQWTSTPISPFMLGRKKVVPDKCGLRINFDGPEIFSAALGGRRPRKSSQLWQAVTLQIRWRIPFLAAHRSTRSSPSIALTRNAYHNPCRPSWSCRICATGVYVRLS
jgi:hypothetical protein